MGQTKPRLHTPLLKADSKIEMVKELAVKIGMPLLPWQEFVLKDMLSVDKSGNWIRKSNLVIVARQSGKTHLARMRLLAGLFCFDEKRLLMMAQSRSMALVTFREIVYSIENCPELLEQVKNPSS